MFSTVATYFLIGLASSYAARKLFEFGLRDFSFKSNLNEDGSEKR